MSRLCELVLLFLAGHIHFAAANEDVYVSFVVDAEVGPDALDPSCESYDEFAAEVQRNIDASFNSIQGYQSAEVVSRRNVEKEDNLY